MNQLLSEAEIRKAAPTTKSNAASQDTTSICNSKRVVGAVQAKPHTKYSLIWAARITPAARKMVLLALANYSDADGSRIYPAVATVAEHCCLSVNATRSHIHALKEAGLLCVVRQATQHRATVYAMNLEAISALTKSGVLTNFSTPESGGLEAPALQISSASTPESGADPIDPDVSQGIWGVTTPPGPSASPPPLGAGSRKLPIGLDLILFDKLVKNGKNTESRIEALVERAHELVKQGHDVNALLNQAIERGWVAFPLPPRPTPPAKRTKRATSRTGGKAMALHLGEAGEASEWELHP
jgi:hypothetical protein